MAGRMMNLVSKREFDFSNGSADVVVVKALDASQYTEGLILMRVHAADIGSGNTIDAIARKTAPSVDDPATDFVVSASDVAKATASSTAAAGDLNTAALSADFGGSLRILIKGTRSTGNCKATISVDLSLKE